MVPVGALGPGLAVPRLVRLVARPSPPTAARAWCSPASRPRRGPTTGRRRPWYYHRFYDFQPDLNIANPQVREEIKKIMRVLAAARRRRIPDGRGAVHHRADRARATRTARRTSPFLTELRQHLQWRKGDAVLLAEANVEPDQLLDYFGDEGGSNNRHPHAVRLHAQRPAAARARPAEPGADHRRAAGHAEAAARRAVGDVPAQPRRDRPVPAHRRAARRGVRAVRPGREHAAVRPGHPPPAGADARQRPRPPRTRLLAAVHACAARPCCATARRSAWATTCPGRAATPSARRCSGRSPRTAASPPRTPTGSCAR